MFLKLNLINLSKNIGTICCKTRIFPKSFKTSDRFLSNNAGRLSVGHRSLRELKFMETDKIPSDYKLIYRAPLQGYLIATKHVFTMTTVVVVAEIIYKLIKDPSSIIHLPVEEHDFSGLILAESDLIYFGFGFLALTCIVNIFIKKYPLRIYRHQNNYIAIFEKQLPFRDNRLYFQKGDVSDVKPFPLNPWRESMYKMKGKNVLLLSHHFKTPSEFNDLFKK